MAKQLKSKWSKPYFSSGKHAPPRTRGRRMRQPVAIKQLDITAPGAIEYRAQGHMKLAGKMSKPEIKIKPVVSQRYKMQVQALKNREESIKKGFYSIKPSEHIPSSSQSAMADYGLVKTNQGIYHDKINNQSLMPEEAYRRYAQRVNIQQSLIRNIPMPVYQEPVYEGSKTQQKYQKRLKTGLNVAKKYELSTNKRSRLMGKFIRVGLGSMAGLTAPIVYPKETIISTVQLVMPWKWKQNIYEPFKRDPYFFAGNVYGGLMFGKVLGKTLRPIKVKSVHVTKQAFSKLKGAKLPKIKIRQPRKTHVYIDIKDGKPVVHVSKRPPVTIPKKQHVIIKVNKQGRPVVKLTTKRNYFKLGKKGQMAIRQQYKLLHKQKPKIKAQYTPKIISIPLYHSDINRLNKNRVLYNEKIIEKQKISQLDKLKLDNEYKPKDNIKIQQKDEITPIYPPTQMQSYKTTTTEKTKDPLLYVHTKKKFETPPINKNLPVYEEKQIKYVPILAMGKKEITGNPYEKFEEALSEGYTVTDQFAVDKFRIKKIKTKYSKKRNVDLSKQYKFTKKGNWYVEKKRHKTNDSTSFRMLMSALRKV